MSNLELDPRETAIGGSDGVQRRPVRELLAGHEVALGGIRGMSVTRTLPHRVRRTVGAWCFVDSYGPYDLVAGAPMRLAAHPHIGLQTVSWLVAGEVMHRDSVGSEQLITPGQLNLMTAGRGIAHSESTPQEHSRWLHGVQLWVALPGGSRSVQPTFEHHAELPVLRTRGLRASVLLGSLGDVTSPARAYTPIVGADVEVVGGGSGELPLRPDFEHAVLVLAGEVVIDGEPLAAGPLLYLGCGRSSLTVSATEPARMLLLGGEPFEEQLVMWWNFVGRSHEDIVEARTAWAAGERFGAVGGPDGLPMPSARLRPRPRVS